MSRSDLPVACLGRIFYFHSSRLYEFRGPGCQENSTVKICKSPIGPEAIAVAFRHFRLLVRRSQQAQKGVNLLAGVSGPNNENAGLLLSDREE